MVRFCGRLGEPDGNASRLTRLNLTDAIVRFSQATPKAAIGHYLIRESKPQTPARPARRPIRVIAAIAREVPYNRRIAWP
jgi:hypothetical protein